MLCTFATPGPCCLLTLLFQCANAGRRCVVCLMPSDRKQAGPRLALGGDCWGICTDLSCVCAQTICRGIIDNMLRLCRRDDTDMATCGSFMAMLEGPGVYEHLSAAAVEALVEVGALMSGWAPFSCAG